MLTDNNLLTYVLTTAKLDTRGHHWVDSCCDYDFVIKSRSGRKNSVADRLSQVPSNEKQERLVLPEVLKTLSFSLTVENCPLVESMALTDTSASIPLLLQPEVF